MIMDFGNRKALILWF